MEMQILVNYSQAVVQINWTKVSENVFTHYLIKRFLSHSILN